MTPSCKFLSYNAFLAIHLALATPCTIFTAGLRCWNCIWYLMFGLPCVLYVHCVK